MNHSRLVVVALVAAAGCSDHSSGGAVPLAAVAPATSAAPTPSVSASPGSGSVALPRPTASAPKLWPRQAAAPALPIALAGHAWLADTSLWTTWVDHAGKPQGPGDRGVYGLGNGRVFSLVGSAYPLNTLHELIGPSYQLTDGYFGDVSSALVVAGKEPTVLREGIFKPRRVAATITQEVTAQGELFVVDVAPPGRSSIVRVVVVKNPSPTPLTSVRVVTRIAGGARPELDRLVQDRVPYKLSIGRLGGGGKPSSGELSIDLGTVPANGEAVAALTLVTTRAGAGEAAEIQALEQAGADRLLDETQLWWSSWFARGAELRLPDPKVQDLVDEMLLHCRIQQAEYGGLSPVSRYTKCFIRDNEGPLLLYLALARPEDVKTQLTYLYKASIAERTIANSISLDHAPATIGPPPGWANVSFMPGRNPAEAPSYISLFLHHWWKATGDTALPRELFDFALAALDRQEVSPRGLMKWSGDEAFRFTIASATGLFNHEKNAYGTHTSFLFAAAAERLADLAVALGRPADGQRLRARALVVRDSIEREAWLGTHWSPTLFFWGNLRWPTPFEDVNLMPLHLGYLPPDDARAESNLLETIKRLGRGPGRVQSRSLIGGFADAYDGMVPGYLLENLSLLEHPDAEAAFNALEKVSLTSGETAEGHWFDGDRAIVLQYSADGRGAGDTTARLRPWEGGLNVHALVQYLIGARADATLATPRLRLAPHLPNDWPTLEARGLAAGAARVDLAIAERAGVRTYDLSNTGSTPVEVELVVAAGSVRELSVDGRPLALATLPVRSKWGRVRVTLPAIALAPGTASRVVIKL